MSPKELIRFLDCRFSIHKVNQIHGSNVIKASNASRPPWPSADSLISDKKRQSLWIYSADCIPVLFADPVMGHVAAVHSGWKGISNKVLLKTIEALKRLGAIESQLIVALGPAISCKNYQIDFHAVESIYKGIYQDLKDDQTSINEKVSRMHDRGIVNYDTIPSKFLLDIRLAAATQMCGIGLKHEQIHISGLCTFTQQSLFHSWRRDKVKKMQWSVIAS